MKQVINIAIDGPAGAGKSTISKKLAEKLGFSYADTGAIYRTIGLYVFRTDANPQDAAQVASLLKDINIDIDFSNGTQKMLLNGEDVTQAIRQHEISKYASDVSAVPEVRAFLLEMQRDIARSNNIIMDGRDIGTIVLPSAHVKIFLTASPEDRANRRYLELKEKAQPANYETILEDVIQRDYNDSHRKIAPLKPADDAIIVDTTGYELERSVATLESIIRGRLNHVL